MNKPAVENKTASGKAALNDIKSQLNSSVEDTAEEAKGMAEDITGRLKATGNQVSTMAREVGEDVTDVFNSGVKATQSAIDSASTAVYDITERTVDAGSELLVSARRYVRTNPGLSVLMGMLGGVVLRHLLTSNSRK